jgi:ATP-binding cassette subfamily C protein
MSARAGEARLAIRLGLVVAALLTLGVNAGVLVVPLYDMHLFDGVLTSRSLDTLALLSVICVAGLLVLGVLLVLRGLALAEVGDRVARIISGPAIAAALRRAVSGDRGAAGRALSDVQEIRLFFGGGAAAAPLDLAGAPFFLAVIFLLHPLLGWYALGAALVLLSVTLAAEALSQPRLAEAQARMDRALQEASALLRDPTLREGLGMAPAIERRWRVRRGAALVAGERASLHGESVAAVGRLVRGLLQGGMLAFAAWLVLRNEATPGVLVGTNLLFALLVSPLDKVLSHWRSVASARLAWRRLARLLAEDVTPVEGANPSAARGEGISLAGVTFRPGDGDRPVLEDITLAVPPGTIAVVTGPNGAGKSTLARLAAGVLIPSAGDAAVAGAPAWRAAEAGRIGYLPQRPQILEGTVAENIARFGSGGTEAIVEAARLAGLHGAVGRLPLGYATPVGPEHPALSGGERQRLALARALFGAPPVLVLDEPDASLDHAGEAVLIEALEAARRRGAAILAVTHRRGILAIADRVWRLEGGRLLTQAGASASPSLRTSEMTP